MNYDQATEIEAIQQAIQKWEGICMGCNIDSGINNCALCLKYLDNTDNCTACPICKVTGREGCLGTPYSPWAYSFKYKPGSLLGIQHGIRKKANASNIHLAIAELEFLYGVLELTINEYQG